jgi:GNAT superfamily N-acetyltransferase
MEDAQRHGGERDLDVSIVNPAVPDEFDPWAGPDLVQAVLADGTPIVVLPVGPGEDDHRLLREELLEHFAELSAESRHRRFLTSVPELSPSMLHRLVDTVDNVDHVVVTAQVLDSSASPKPMHGSLVGLPVGLARFIRDPQLPTSADVAVTVVDEWQRRGVGGLLVWSLAQAALRRGVDTFVADVLATNAAPLALLRHAGTVTRSPADQGAVHVVASLHPAPPLRAAKSARLRGGVD